MALTKVDSGKYTSDERLYLNAKGEVVKEGDPKATSLLVGEGSEISAEDAEKYGLLKAEADAPEGEDKKAKKAADKPAAPAEKATDKKK